MTTRLHDPMVSEDIPKRWVSYYKEAQRRGNGVKNLEMKVMEELGAAEKRAADAEAQVKALSRPVSEIWFQQWRPIINAIGEISVQEAMDVIERGL